MQPSNNLSGPSPQTPGGHYDFIFQQPPKKKRNLIPTANSSKKQRVLTAVGGGIGLIVLISLFFTIMGSANKSKVNSLMDLATQETEIIRVANITLDKGRASSTKSFAISTSYSIISARRETAERLRKYGKKVADKDLAIGRSAASDKQLAEAKIGNNFDEVATGILTKNLSTYKTALKTYYNATEDTTNRLLFEKHYTGANTLLGSKDSISSLALPTPQPQTSR